MTCRFLSATNAFTCLSDLVAELFRVIMDDLTPGGRANSWQDNGGYLRYAEH